MAGLPEGFTINAEASLPEGFSIDQKVDPHAPVDFDFMTALENLPSSGAALVGDLVQAVTHPIETGKAIGDLAQSASNAMGRNMAEFVQGVDMEPDMEGRSEAMADSMVGAVKDRYGSINALKRTAMNDPAGMVLDVAGVGVASKIPKVNRIAASLEPIGGFKRAVTTPFKAVLPDRIATKLYDSAVKFSTKIPESKRREMVQTLLDGGVMPTTKGIAKVESRLEFLNNSITNMIRESAESGVAIPIEKIGMHLNDLRSTKGGVRLGNVDDLKAIDKISKKFFDSMGDRKTITPEELQFFKTQAYKDINWDAKRGKGKPIKQEVYRSMAEGAKDAIQEVIPETADINRQLGLLIEAKKPLMTAANRIENKDIVGIGTPINIGVGHMTGGTAGGVTGGIVSLLNNPKAKARIAITIRKIKNQDYEWLHANVGRAEMAIATELAGRIDDLEIREPSEGGELGRSDEWGGIKGWLLEQEEKRKQSRATGGYDWGRRNYGDENQ